MSGFDLDPAFVRDQVRRFLREDIGEGDITTSWTVPAGAAGRARVVAREPCVVAGLPVAAAVFAELDGRVACEPLVEEGAEVRAGAALMRVAGPAAPILSGERVALNLIQHLSGIATVTRRYVAAVAGTRASVSDTRKTTPGLRAFEKYAVRAGGGRNHRAGLFDAVLIKDNHAAAAGGVGPAVRAALARAAGRGVTVQAEVESIAELREALDAGAPAVLLDNMSPGDTAAAVAIARSRAGGGAVWIESSGGITLPNIRAYAEAGVDTISVGALTHSAPAVDISLDFEP